MSDYKKFLDEKQFTAPPVGIANPPDLSPLLFPFQRDLTHWALRRGRAAVWADCGLGKGWIALEWARVVSEHTGGNVLILAPLAVAQQFQREAVKLAVDPPTLCRDSGDVRPGMNVTNYDRLHNFDSEDFAGVVLDESSILKDYTAKTRNALIAAFERTRFKLCCTATPAPNDFTEVGNHAEFLGAMTRAEMLSMFFVHDGGSTQDWRIKGHAKDDYWRWVCTWAAMLKKPSDLGYSDDGYELPALHIHENVIDTDTAMARDAGMLFAYEARTLSEQRAAKRASINSRVKAAAELANNSSEPWLVWCELNDESAALSRAIPDAVEVKGADSVEHKERAAIDFIDGRIRVLVSKPSILGWGLNLQHCAHVAYVGLSHSFEQWYQSLRRTWRFGQEREVNCHVITSSAEGRIVANLQRKAADADKMAAGMVVHMADITRSELRATSRTVDLYNPTLEMTIPEWLKTEVA